ncbi:hypothetical protein [Bremerella alba]|uniref:Uncharacterized protein n=1 Tax=Bremerella alba TaxID=980252 RepID=A0A7V8V453_9BACT|nr:hypothetical protein [Bremerella alba]MBA2114568.1 hypothetical protein [Bremerella alba]
MRLTLRTLLAHEHGLLNEQQAELIALKIEQSPFVAQLLRHLKDRAARREIVPLAIEARGTLCLERVSQYLDYVLPAEEVVKLENECFASDRLLAEVASCHEIIAQWLSTPTPTEPALRQRLYAIMPGPIESIPAANDEIAIDLTALTYQSAPPSTPLAEKQVVADRPVPAKGGWVGGTFRLFALAASVLVLVTFVTMNRDKVEAMIAQHWQSKSLSASEPKNIPEVPTDNIAPDVLVSQVESMASIETTSPKAAVPALLPEVATTAFHMPVSIDQDPLVSNTWNVDTALGTLLQDSLSGSWQAAKIQQLTTNDVVVSPGGHCRIIREGIQLELRPLSELSLSEGEVAKLRYGSLIVDMQPGKEFTLDVAGQQVKILASHGPVRLGLSTRAVVARGLDFATQTANQEVHFEGISGEAELVIPSCRGPIPVQYGQKVIAHMNHGVRGGDVSEPNESWIKTPGSVLAKAIQNSGEPIRYLQDSRSAEMPGHRLDATITLVQLGQVDVWGEASSSIQDPQLLESHLMDVQNLLAQDSALAQATKSALLRQSPEHGPLIYRLICGFSDDQLTDETRLQLETLLRHPEPTVRAWTQFQLSKRQNR